MRMDAPAPANALDSNAQGLIGQALDRVDGPLKVTGSAKYAHDFEQGSGMLHGYIVTSQIACGELASIETRAAEQAPGVVLVMTHRTAPLQGARPRASGEDRYARPCPQLADKRIHHFGQPVAFVVAETWEQARWAAELVEVNYHTSEGAYTFEALLAQARRPAANANREPDSVIGNFAAVFERAPVPLEARYSTPCHIHAQMEPHASVAAWDGDRVVIHCSAQLLNSAQRAVAATLRVEPHQVRILSPYIGGGFGGKLPIHAEVILAAIAARVLHRPVKAALTRTQMFHISTHRSATVQRVRLAADTDGRLQAIAHESWSHHARADDFYESAAMQTRSLYAAATRLTTHRAVALDVPYADSTRAPGEAVGMLALEQAMDELAEKLNLDPIELRMRNEPALDPELALPFSSRQLVECLRVGAERFDWDRRRALPAQVIEGRSYIGMGVAAATRDNYLRASHCALTLDHSGMLLARMAMTDIGTGSYTVLSQIAAEMLGLPLAKVRVDLGDSDYPATPGSGGSWGAASAGSGLFDACQRMRAKLAQRADTDLETARFENGMLVADGKSWALSELAGAGGLHCTGEILPGRMESSYSQQAYGAHFAEVSVDRDTGEIRVRRMLGVFAAGRILNQKTARSQVLGAMIWGVGAALHEAAYIGARSGHFVTRDLAGYHVPAHADIPDIDALFIPEVDDKANPLKIKGVGELGICGAGAAIANAVYNACGVRIRDYPLTLDKVLAGLEGTPS